MGVYIGSNKYINSELICQSLNVGIFKCNRFGMNEACKRVIWDTLNSTLIKATVFFGYETMFVVRESETYPSKMLSPFRKYKNNLFT